MGAVTGLLGIGGGAGGTNFAGPEQASITNPVTMNQISSGYTENQAALSEQKNLLNAIRAQQGFQNQSNVYGQLQNMVAGQGPNPAQAMLAKATGQNVANQAALMAGQRGASQNVGLVGRQAAQMGSNAQQQASNDAAILQANQSMNALNQAGSMANNMVANQVGQTNANTQAQQAAQAQLYNAQQGVNQASVGSQGGINAANAGMASTRMQGQPGMIGGLLNGAGAALGMMGANGGMVARMAEGGEAPQAGPVSKFGQFITAMAQPQQAADAPEQAWGQMTPNQQLEKGASNFASSGVTALKGMMGGGAGAAAAPAAAAPAVGGLAELGPLLMLAAKGGQVPAMLSPGEKYLPPQAVEQVKQGANPMAVGKTVPGKPAVSGSKNSYANDTVSASLEEGGIVVPRSATQSKNPQRASADFVHKVLAKRAAGGRR